MIKQKLTTDYELLKKQITLLEYSVSKCNSIGLKEDFSMDEFSFFETLCSRYSRSIDFLIRKIFRTIDEFEFENQGTLVDVVNNAHKRDLINSVDRIREMKDLRNTIVHEYIEENLVELFSEVVEFSTELIEVMITTKKYIEKKI
ncbi:MAG: hypothetical protein JXR64_01820 [Spirochaetales bacterium]|nr:hypothetical protein [Spirochaetales bacterium]